ncbi:hypothetical protein M885DRAFT_550618 [Pelagophyceae sp. CCMP2097]|nr:hypothetical protein M885DRAFT_550618 [Pelagophyceae sp. CCMP2097]
MAAAGAPPDAAVPPPAAVVGDGAAASNVDLPALESLLGKEEGEMADLLDCLEAWSERDAFLGGVCDGDDVDVNSPLLCDDAAAMDPAMLEALLLLRDGDDPPSALAVEAKERGNKYFATAVKTKRDKWYREAAKQYSDGLALCRAADAELGDFVPPAVRAALLLNRAQCSILLKNYGNAKADCRDAIKAEPKNAKAWYRLARACASLKQWKDAKAACDFGIESCEGLAADAGEGKALCDLAAKAVNEMAALEEQARLAKAAEVVRHSAWRAVYAAATVNRGKVGPTEVRHEFRLQGRNVSPQLRDGRLTWPVLFSYPEVGDAHPDLAEAVDVDDLLAQWLGELYPDDDEGPQWDTDGTYKCSGVAVYARRRAVDALRGADEYVTYCDSATRRDADECAAAPEDDWFEVSPAATLRELMDHPLHVAPPIITLEVRPTTSTMHSKWRKHIESKHGGFVFVGLRLGPDGTAG